ncbi:MAG TPA: hypothetical protein PLV68_09420 [Ilumatobacteraceae bacterium]|nr:hypothetical protein [Ilumatobacteraceae bacterium]
MSRLTSFVVALLLMAACSSGGGPRAYFGSTIGADTQYGMQVPQGWHRCEVSAACEQQTPDASAVMMSVYTYGNCSSPVGTDIARNLCLALDSGDVARCTTAVAATYGSVASDTPALPITVIAWKNHPSSDFATTRFQAADLPKPFWQVTCARFLGNGQSMVAVAMYARSSADLDSHQQVFVDTVASLPSLAPYNR